MTTLPAEVITWRIPQAKPMILSESDVERSLRDARAAFPRFSRWDHNNEANESYAGFAVWGEFIPDPDEPMPRFFFITFDIYRDTWAGHLTIGKPCYYWSDADGGEAYLVDTAACATVEGAIAGLKRQIADLFTAILGRNTGSVTPPG